MLLLAIAVHAWPGALAIGCWQRDAVANGQGWRLLTAHWVHLDTRHLLFNLAALVLLCEMFWERLALAELLVMMVVCSLGVSLMLTYFSSALQWYAGLSGVLHGLWSGAALLTLARTRTVFPALALLLLVLKLYAWPVSVSGVTVVAAAHVDGALAGLVGALLCLLWEFVAFRLKCAAAKERCDESPAFARLGKSSQQPRSRYFFSKERRA